MKKKLNILIITIIFFNSCSNDKVSSIELNNSTIKDLIYNLNGSNWQDVDNSKNELEKLEEKSLPYLFENLGSEKKYVKLENTCDLIYPGATEFYGEGWYIEYDIDWIAIRTGWVIEEITFKDFGFKEIVLTDKNLLKTICDTFSNRDENKIKELINILYNEKDKKINKAIKKANKWWEKNKNSWTRIVGISDAIKSNDIEIQSNALNYLIFGENCINGLTREYFEKELRQNVEDMKNSNELLLNENAKQLLEMVDYKGDFIFFNITTKCWNYRVGKGESHP